MEVLMTSLQARAKMKEYLKEHSIYFQEGVEDGVVRYLILFEGYESCPNKVLEASIWFYPDVMECSVYYDYTASEWCRESEHREELMRLLNFCNARIWTCTDDGMNGALYHRNYLYTSRF